MNTDMTVEKLQKVATTHVDAAIKARWLRWWNYTAAVKLQNKFPHVLPLREKLLDGWLIKASWWAQVLPFFIIFHYGLFSNFHNLFLSMGFCSVVGEGG